jgi:hypothetical protein
MYSMPGVHRMNVCGQRQRVLHNDCSRSGRVVLLKLRREYLRIILNLHRVSCNYRYVTVYVMIFNCYTLYSRHYNEFAC